MHEACGPPKFEQRDWANFDFSRWNLDGLGFDATSAAIAELSSRLFASEEWRQHFQGSLPALQRGVLTVYRERLVELENEKTAVAREFDERIAAAAKRSEEFGKAIETSSAPPVAELSAETYHAGVRVTAADGQVGLPGIVVQITTPRDPKNVLAQGVTDRDGNALLTVPVAKAGDLDKGDATLEVLTLAGKPLEKLVNGVCIRPNQNETKVVSLKDSPDTAAHKSAALAFRAEREAVGRDLVTSIERLKQERQARLYDLDCRLDETRKLIAEIEQPSTPSEPTTPPTTRPETPEARPASPTDTAPPVPKRPQPSRRSRRRR